MSAQKGSVSSPSDHSVAVASSVAFTAACVVFLGVTVGFSAAREVAVASAGVAWLVLAGYCVSRREVFARTAVSANAVATVAAIVGLVVLCSTWSAIPADVWMLVLLADLGVRLFAALASYRYRIALESLNPMFRVSALLRLGGWAAIALVPADVMNGRTITAIYEVFAVSAAVSAVAMWEAKRSKEAAVKMRRASTLSVSVGELSVTVDGGVLIANTAPKRGALQKRVELPQLVDLAEKSPASGVTISNKPVLAPTPAPTPSSGPTSNGSQPLEDQPVVVFDLAGAEAAARASAPQPKVSQPTIILEETSYGVVESVTVSLEGVATRERHS